ncbi:hypothetical protein [Nitrosovibrio sp. Nv4]|uniref:hypothetical protein n=1 Tax=Nitrosovibrio sp. Nv4 TaxID=1945880 RepID=UPI000BD12796|nr:hypothetical protein [Nitrosovibrio sp. Nv4]SOD41169.1 hypothetical protein SAMN06298226_1462 [Nitrosovibrio sp. Nv4]
MSMSYYRSSAAVEVISSAHHASLLVALHVTKRQNGAKASNRVSIRAGKRSTPGSSYEALSIAGSVMTFLHWFGGTDTSAESENV